MWEENLKTLKDCSTFFPQTLLYGCNLLQLVDVQRDS